MGVRLHSSGDFYSVQYIAFWERVFAIVPQIHFWAYTRSWARADLRPVLESLKERTENLQLFASWDAAMPTAPAGWRRSIVTDQDRGSRVGIESAAYLRCPEETAHGPNCASCGFCVQPHDGDVVFTAH